jgi:hypothetical protein
LATVRDFTEPFGAGDPYYHLGCLENGLTERVRLTKRVCAWRDEPVAVRPLDACAAGEWCRTSSA